MGYLKPIKALQHVEGQPREGNEGAERSHLRCLRHGDRINQPTNQWISDFDNLQVN